MATSPATEDAAVSKTTLMPPAPYKEDALTVRSPEPLPRKRRRVGPSPPPTPTPQPSNVSPTISNVSPTISNVSPTLENLPTATPAPSKKRPHATITQAPPSPLPAPSTPEPSRKRRRPESLDALRVVLPPPLDVDAAPLRCQITPPPSDRMLDHRNPPQPPRKAKKRRRQADDVGDARPRPRLALAELPRLSAGALSPLLEVPPSLGLGSRMSPSSPALPPAPMPIPAARSPSRAPRRIVFRSLAAEFDAVANDDDDDADDQSNDTERSYRHRNVRLQAPPAITRVLAPVRRTDVTTTASPTLEANTKETSPTNNADVPEKKEKQKCDGDDGCASAVTHVKPVPTRPSRAQDVPRFPCERRASTSKRDQEVP